MENEYIGRGFGRIDKVRIWIDETKTLAQLSRLLDAFLLFWESNPMLLDIKATVEDMVRAKVVVGFGITEPAKNKDLRDWQVWFRKLKAIPTTTDNSGGDSKVEQSGPLHKEINFAERTVIIGDKSYHVTGTQAWAVIVELKDNQKLTKITPTNEWKNAIDSLRRKVDGADNLRKIIQYTNGGYVFYPDVKLIGIGQVGIRKTY